MTSDPAVGYNEIDLPEPGSPEDPYVEIQLVGYPLQIGFLASQHYDEVFREFALLSASTAADPDAIPARLLRLIDALGRRYASQQEHEAERDAALLRGETTRNFTLVMPTSVAEAGAMLDVMLDETDDFCRDGVLLTLEAPADVVVFRRWYLHQLIDQIGGAAPAAYPGNER